MAREKISKMKEVREQLLVGEQEKIRILEDLLKQRDEYQSDIAGYIQVCNHGDNSLSRVAGILLWR